jgi:ABC-type nickel/cobalt efflux system permease component RcnA
MLAGAIRSAYRTADEGGREHDCGCHHRSERRDAAGFGFLSLAIGAVPCTGALMVLLCGVANDLLWPSVLMVTSISAGMAVALSSVGIAAILGRRLVETRLERNVSRRRRIIAGLRITGAALVMLIGLALFSFTLLGGAPAALQLVAN